MEKAIRGLDHFAFLPFKYDSLRGTRVRRQFSGKHVTLKECSLYLQNVQKEVLP